MKAAVATDKGLEIRDIPQPKPKPHEVLVRVRAASLNRADLNAARGVGGHGAVGATLGLDWSGEVVEAGNEVKGGFKAGDRVMCAGAGGYAEYAVADWGRVTPMPTGLTFEKAATLPVAVATMHDALVTNGRLTAGQSVMIQGASAGVGLMALQIAKLLGARLVIGTFDQRRAARPAQRVRRRPRRRYQQSGMAGRGPQSDRRQGRQPDHRSGFRRRRQRQSQGQRDPRPHRQCRAARRRQGRVRFRPACRAPHHLYRRHSPHPLGRRTSRGNPRDVEGPRRRHRGRQALAANRQDVSTRSSRRRARAHEGESAFREDLADALISFGETT